MYEDTGTFYLSLYTLLEGTNESVSMNVIERWERTLIVVHIALPSCMSAYFTPLSTVPTTRPDFCLPSLFSVDAKNTRAPYLLPPVHPRNGHRVDGHLLGLLQVCTGIYDSIFVFPCRVPRWAEVSARQAERAAGSECQQLRG